MKSDRNKSINKRYNTTSDYNKRYIRWAMHLSSATIEGITAEEIVNRLASRKRSIHLTVRTVHRLLNQLIADDKVFKFNKKYFLKDLFIDDRWSVFAEFLNEFQTQYQLNKIASLKMYSDDETLEAMILNLGNVIGAFITYVLIESLKPNERLISISERTQISKNFLQDAINLQLILPSLLRILPGSPDRMIMGKDQESLEKITSAYNIAYPGFSELLDDRFRKYISFHRIRRRGKSCKHEWHRINIHKIGERSECSKCLGLAEEHDLNHR